MDLKNGLPLKKMKCAVFFTLFFLCACELKVSTNVNVSDLLAGNDKIFLSELKAEVSSCTDDVDESEPSEDVFKIQRLISKNITGSQYTGCTNDFPNSFAEFSVPASFSAFDSPRKTGEVYRLLRKGTTFYFDFSPQIIRDLEKKNHISLTLASTIVVTNDTNKTIKYKTMAAFVNDTPVISETLTLAPFKKAIIRPSDVSVAKAKKGEPAFFMEIIPE